MGNQNYIGLKYCCNHKPVSLMYMDERGYQVCCHQCGKTVNGYDSEREAVAQWNKKIMEKRNDDKKM